MCGFAGFVNLRPTSGTGGILKRMTDAIAHRGPDDNRFYTDDYAALGHLRLSIIDVASGAPADAERRRQPSDHL